MNTPDGSDPGALDGDDDGPDEALPLLYNVVYCSRASPQVDEAEVARIVATARRLNPQHDITGMLVFGSGIFFQWLEGPRDPVVALMDRLRQDPRHRDVVQLSESEEHRDRVFPAWDMEWVGTQDIHEVLADAMETAEDPAHAATLALLLDELKTGQLSALRPNR
ncbi:MAG: BLUF domain-containing protein [Rubrivivax sp.]